jgi:N-hydroxyarylamine O-acetyltransferase
VSPVSPLQDLDAYLKRIGLDGPRPLAEVHRAHATTIPFENFDPLSGRPVELGLERLEEKLVAHRRGGYCFEQNLLLKAAMESLGADEVVPMLARVRVGPDGPRPLNHLLLRVVERGVPWLADVGFGGAGLLDPVPFEPGTESEQDGWRYRLVDNGDEYVLETFQDGEWTAMYGFVPAEAPMIDIEVSNWFTCTRPDSIFVTQVFAGARRVDRCLSLLVGEEPVVVERPVGGASVSSPVPIEDVPRIFAERFGLDGVRVGEGGRLSLDERP